MNFGSIVRTAVISAVAAFSFTLGSCGDAANDDAGNDTASATAGVDATVDTAAAPVETRFVEGRGKVTKIDRENGRVELDHEKIEAWPMDAMVMPFPVADAALLDAVETGKTYLFTVELSGDDYKITKFTAAP